MKKKKVTVRNSVAKFARKVNKAATHKDDKNDYQRKNKKNQSWLDRDFFPVAFLLKRCYNTTLQT